MQLDDLITKALKFREERNWKQYHSARNIALSIVLESAELLEIFQWKTDAESKQLLDDPVQRENIADELSDILLYSILMANDLNIDIIKAADKKIDKNAAKYPVDKVKGRAVKYTEL
jgi:NTP pyrophosphatase (non-canonical NTP hydrolase)